MFVGFDLIAEEDSNYPLSYYETILANYHDLSLMLHAGESNLIENKNIATALNLGTVRLGHGLNLYYFPELIEEVKEKDVMI